ncbi:hypothetical protein BJX61DRAFT_539041 [Aspergillus egyptiacus]|nr:hypothetical protein BJX61DRAFT_539041 [Aspergillus egyptiacus]
MSWIPLDADNCAPGSQAQGPGQTAGQHPQSTQTLAQPFFFPMYEGLDLQTIDQFLLHQSPPVPHLSGYTMSPPTVPFQTNMGTQGTTRTITPGYSQYDAGTFQNNNSNPMMNHLPIQPNTNPASPQSLAPTPNPNASSPKHTRHSIRCEWKGCTYPGVFRRTAELKRHIDTQHVHPRAYKCTAAGCSQSFNRKDNRGEHVRRRHTNKHSCHGAEVQAFDLSSPRSV